MNLQTFRKKEFYIYLIPLVISDFVFQYIVYKFISSKVGYTNPEDAVMHMSAIGPRPHMEKQTIEYEALIDKYMLRHLCKPGISGWAQVNGYRGETSELEQMAGRVKYDIWYIENWSLLLDLKIFVKTFVQCVIKDDKQAY